MFGSHLLLDKIGPRSPVSRRCWLRSVTATALGGMATGVWAEQFASLTAAMAAQNNRQRSCILLWMTGGPSQLDTFDMKPGHANGGEFKEIAAPCVRCWAKCRGWHRG